jgi:hypothetical protein
MFCGTGTAVLKSALGCWVTPVDPRKPLAKRLGEDFAQAAVQLSRRQPGADAAPDYPAVELDDPHRVGTMPRHRLAGAMIGNAPFGLAGASYAAWQSEIAVSNFHVFKKLSRFRELWRSLKFVAKL